MFIGDYPAIHYGSVLYIVQHDGCFRVTVLMRNRYSDSKETINLHGKSDYSYQTTQFYVNISEAERKSVVDKIRSCINNLTGTVANVFDQYGKWKKRPQIRFGFGKHPDLKATYDYYIEPNDTIEICGL